MMWMLPKQMRQKQLDYMNRSRNAILKHYFYPAFRTKGKSTRKVTHIPEELCGVRFSKST